MRDETGLERSYRHLLWAYPRFYRRDRGLEILTTMLDAAEPGRRRPTRAEVVHLLLSGLRCRLVPPGWAGKIAASVVTLWVAVVLGGVGAYAVWRTHPVGPPEAPTLDEAIASGRAASVWTHGSDELDLAYSYKSWAELQTFAEEGWAGQRPAPTGYTRLYEQAGPAPAALTGVHQRLRDQGWRTGTMTPQETCACGVFWASRDGVLLRVHGYAAQGGGAAIEVGVHRAEPAGVLAAAIAGFVVGLVLAWPMMTWLAHRFARTPSGDRMLALLFGLPVVYACLANTVDNVLSMVPDPDSSGVLLAADFMYPLANQVANPLAPIVIALGLAASVAVTTFTPWRRRRPAGRSG